MSSALRLALVTAIGLTVLVEAGRLHGQAAVSSKTDLVVTYASVRGADGRVGQRLTKDDFEIIENGNQHEITAFADDAGPIAVAVVIETETLFAEADVIFQVARTFGASLRADDLAGITNLSQNAGQVNQMNRRREDLLLGLIPSPNPEDRRSLWDGMGRALASLGRATDRRVVLVLSGEKKSAREPMFPLDDSAGILPSSRPPRSVLSSDDIARRVERDGVVVYSVSVAGTTADRRLTRLALLSGGAAVTAHKDAPIGHVLAELVGEMHDLYLLGFSPSQSDGKEHRIQVRVRMPGAVVRARQTYVAARPK